MLYSLTDRCTENVENNLTDNEEQGAKDQISQRPSILQSVDYQQDLHAEIDKQCDRRNNVEYNEHSNRVGGAEAGPIFECSERDESGDEEEGECDRS